MMEALLGIGSAFGLSTSAGLNAYIPMLLVSILTRMGWLQLSEPYNVMGDWWVIGTLSVLLIIEMLVDKIPAVDSINDLIQTLVRPAAGALLFAANANVITDVSPVIAIIFGILLAGGVHATKGVVRPVVTASTAGVGNPIVSTLEDIVALVVSILSMIVPIIIMVVLVLAFAWLFFRWLSRRNREKLAF